MYIKPYEYQYLEDKCGLTLSIFVSDCHLNFHIPPFRGNQLSYLLQSNAAAWQAFHVLDSKGLSRAAVQPYIEHFQSLSRQWEVAAAQKKKKDKGHLKAGRGSKKGQTQVAPQGKRSISPAEEEEEDFAVASEQDQEDADGDTFAEELEQGELLKIC